MTLNTGGKTLHAPSAVWVKSRDPGAKLLRQERRRSAAPSPYLNGIGAGDAWI